MDKLLSVIVPVYNVEKTLNRCIKSIVKQTYKNLELILVDDGSIDSSSRLCKEWCKRDDRIILNARKQNEGVAAARNIGMQMCHGDYIAFVDSDDYLEVDAYSRMISAIKQDGSDMAVCNYWNCKENTKKKSVAYQLGNCCKEDILQDYMLEKLPAVVWGKVVKRELMMPEHREALWFPEGRRYEDMIMSFRQVLEAGKISIIAKPLYYYMQNDNTITANPCLKDSLDILKNLDEIKSLAERKVPKEIMACYLCSLLVFALQLYYRSGERDKMLRQKILDEIHITKKALKFKVIGRSKKWKKLLVCKAGLADVVVSRTVKENE